MLNTRVQISVASQFFFNIGLPLLLTGDFVNNLESYLSFCGLPLQRLILNEVATSAKTYRAQLNVQWINCSHRPCNGGDEIKISSKDIRFFAIDKMPYKSHNKGPPKKNFIKLLSFQRGIKFLVHRFIGYSRKSSDGKGFS